MLAVILSLHAPLALGGQEPPPTTDQSTSEPKTLDDTIEAGEADAEEPARKLVRWNEYEGKLFTIRLGGGFLYDYADYAQDDTSRAQFELQPQGKVRDARFSLKGRLKFDRPVTWTCGIMYNGPTDEFLIRETGFMVAVIFSTTSMSRSGFPSAPFL